MATKVFGSVVYHSDTRRFDTVINAVACEGVSLSELTQSKDTYILYVFDLRLLVAQLLDLFRGRVSFEITRQATTSRTYRLSIGSLELRSIDQSIPFSSAELLSFGYDVKDVQQLEKLRRSFGITQVSAASTALSGFIATLGNRFNFLTYTSQELLSDREARESLSGGVLELAPDKVDRTLGDGVVLDVNSLYPVVMQMAYWPDRHTATQLTSETSLYEGDFYLIGIELLSLKLKPGRFDAWPHAHAERGRVYWLTSYDWQWIRWSYEVAYRFVGGFGYQRGYHNIFKRYVDELQELKESSKDTLSRKVYKRRLNLLFGKLIGRNAFLKSVPRPWQRGQQVQTFYTKVDYLPHSTLSNPLVASFILARARAFMHRRRVELVKAGVEVVYSDTDSFHIFGKEMIKKTLKVLPIDDRKFGTFKVDHFCDFGRYYCPKFYYHDTVDPHGLHQRHLCCAGLPRQAARDAEAAGWPCDDNFLMHLSALPFLLPTRVKGGYRYDYTTFDVAKADLVRLGQATDWVR